MKQLNRYYRYAKISQRKTRQIIKYFALDWTANKTAFLTGLTHKSVKQIYLKTRSRVVEEVESASPFTNCKIEVDESHFGARRVRGKRGRGAGNKTIVFGIYKRVFRFLGLFILTEGLQYSNTFWFINSSLIILIFPMLIHFNFPNY